MWSALISVGTWLLGKLFGPKDDPAIGLAERAARAETINEGQADASVEAIAAARARRDADARRVRGDKRAAEVNADPADPINLDPDLHLRD